MAEASGLPRTDTSLRLIDGIMLYCAVPATIAYKVFFDEAPFTVEERRRWFETYQHRGPYRMLVAHEEHDGTCECRCHGQHQHRGWRARPMRIAMARSILISPHSRPARALPMRTATAAICFSARRCSLPSSMSKRWPGFTASRISQRPL